MAGLSGHLGGVEPGFRARPLLLTPPSGLSARVTQWSHPTEEADVEGEVRRAQASTRALRWCEPSDGQERGLPPGEGWACGNPTSDAGVEVFPCLWALGTVPCGARVRASLGEPGSGSPGSCGGSVFSFLRQGDAVLLGSHAIMRSHDLGRAHAPQSLPAPVLHSQISLSLEVETCPGLGTACSSPAPGGHLRSGAVETAERGWGGCWGSAGRRLRCVGGVVGAAGSCTRRGHCALEPSLTGDLESRVLATIKTESLIASAVLGSCCLSGFGEDSGDPATLVTPVPKQPVPATGVCALGRPARPGLLPPPGIFHCSAITQAN